MLFVSQIVLFAIGVFVNSQFFAMCAIVHLIVFAITRPAFVSYSDTVADQYFRAKAVLGPIRPVASSHTNSIPYELFVKRVDRIALVGVASFLALQLAGTNLPFGIGYVACYLVRITTHLYWMAVASDQVDVDALTKPEAENLAYGKGWSEVKALIDNDNPGGAVQLATEILDSCDDSESRHTLIGLRASAFSLCGRFEEAIEDYTQYIQFQPSADLYVARALAHESVGDDASAEADFAQAKKTATDQRATFEIGDFCSRNLEFERAARYFEVVVEKSRDLHLRRGARQRAVESLIEARKFETAMSRAESYWSSDSIEFSTYIGWLTAAQDCLLESKTHFENAIRAADEHNAIIAIAHYGFVRVVTAMDVTKETLSAAEQSMHHLRLDRTIAAWEIDKLDALLLARQEKWTDAQALIDRSKKLCDVPSSKTAIAEYAQSIDNRSPIGTVVATSGRIMPFRYS